MHDLSRIRKDSGISEKSECQTKRLDADNQVGQDMNDEKEIGQPYNVSTLISKDGITLISGRGYTYESQTWLLAQMHAHDYMTGYPSEGLNTDSSGISMLMSLRRT